MIRALGVGCVYWPALDPLLRSGCDLASVVEIEPQAFWELVHDRRRGWRYRPSEALLDRAAALPQAKLLHGVGLPVGGSVDDPVEHLAPLEAEVRRFEPSWVSEHLSLNRFRGAGEVEHAGFLLPPGQTPAHVRVAADRLRRLRARLGRPVAFETGVNYLRPRAGEIPDGEFFAAVARAADSGIVLDLHNLWCNECNGRQRVDEVLAALPLERVWEIHLAGGEVDWGYRLDAHSAPVPPEVMDIAARWIPRLPALGALVFELLPEHLPRIGLEGVARQLEALQALWATRPATPQRIEPAHRGDPNSRGASAADLQAVLACESRLRADLRRVALDGATPADDPGLAVLGHLIDEARRSSLARTMRLTLTALLQGLGREGTQAFLEAYLRAGPPLAWPALEAECFAAFARSRIAELRAVAHLEEVLAFEQALVRVTVHGESTELRWSVDPGLLLESLARGEAPSRLPPVALRTRVEAVAA